MSAGPSREEVVERTFHAFRRVMNAMHLRLRGELSRYGLTFPQFMILRHLRAKGRATAKELADLLGVTPGNVTGLLDRLEREGLVTRARSTEDRRVVYVRLTEEGHQRMDTLRREGPPVVSGLFEGWSVEELQALTAMLERVRLSPEEECAY